MKNTNKQSKYLFL